MLSHEQECHGLPEKTNHKSSCDHLRELVMFDCHDFRQQLDGINGTDSVFHDDGFAFADTNGENRQENEFRVLLAEMFQQLNQWKIAQSQQNTQLISRLEELSTTLSGWDAKSSTESFFNKLEIKYKQDDYLPANLMDAHNTPIGKDANRFRKLATLKPSPYIEPPDVPAEEYTYKKAEILYAPPDFPPETVHVAQICSGSGHVERDSLYRASYLARKSKKNSDLQGENSEQRRRQSEACYMLNVALYDDDTDLPTMHAGRRTRATVAQEKGPARCKAYPQMLMRSLWWDLFIAVTIISYAAYMGFQVDWAAKNIDVEVPLEQLIIDFGYTFVFTAELALRMIAEGLHFWSFYNPSVFWNYLDFAIVATSLPETAYDAYCLSVTGVGSESHALSTESRQLRILRVLKHARVLKIFRIFRLVTFVRALRTLLFSIVHTLKSLVWALVLLFLFIYVVAIVLTGTMGEHKRNSGCDASASLCKYWGNLSLAILSLFSAVAGGISWIEIVNPLIHYLHPVWSVFFLAYICFVYFAVLNVITGVFCESAIENAKADVDVAIQNSIDNKKKYIKKLDTLFSWIDTDGSDEITIAELQSYMAQEMSGAFFEILEIEVDYPEEVLKLIDTDGSGNISKDEFIDGICRLRGPATALQIAQLGYFLAAQIEAIGVGADPIKTHFFDNVPSRYGAY